MSTYIDTNHIGESDNTNAQTIASWMHNHGFKLAQDTYNKLSSAGFKTIEDFKLMKSSEIVDAATRMNIMLVDQFALKRARDELGNKKNFVDPEELAIINSIDLKIKVFEDQLNNLTSKEKNIQNIRERIEHEIQTTFKMLSKALHDRKAKLLQTITTISQINNDKIKERKNEINQSLGSINKYKTDTANLMDTAIALNELKNRKVKIEANAQQILKIIKETNERNSTNINENVNFVLDATNIVQAISHLGKHVVPILQSLQYDNNDDKQNKSSIRIEHRIHDEDNKENDINWVSKDFKVENNDIRRMIDDTKTSEKQLQINYENARKLANEAFDQVISETNQQRTKVLAQIDEIHNYKVSQIEEQKQKVNNFLQTLNQNTIPNPKPPQYDKIAINISITGQMSYVKSVLPNIAWIENLPYAPFIQVQSVESRSATILIFITKALNEAGNVKPTRIKLQHTLLDQNEEKSVANIEAVEWITDKINIDQDVMKYEITSLESATIYLLRVCAENMNGWGLFCDSSAFRTEPESIELQDHWNSNSKSDAIQISNSSIFLTALSMNDSYCNKSAYLRQIVNTGINIWKFQLLNCAGDSWALIGIWKVKNDKVKLNTETFFLHKGKSGDNGYGYAVNSGRKHNGSAVEFYGVKCTEKSVVIEMTLNFNDLSLSYKINCVDYGKAYDITKEAYRAVVTLPRPKTQCVLLSYSC
eukprot:98555_1